MIKGVITDEKFGSKHGTVLLSTKLVERGKGDQTKVDDCLLCFAVFQLPKLNGGDNLVYPLGDIYRY
jgi:hypothetical protein